MTPEHHQLKPNEIFGIIEREVVRWRVSDEKLREIIASPHTTTHTVKLSTNAYGEFLFLTTSRPKGQSRICMTFYGLGYHEYRERWFTDEWFWHQTQTNSVQIQKVVPREEAIKFLEQRQVEISPFLSEDTQTEMGRIFEQLADLTDDDAALAEMQDLGLL